MTPAILATERENFPRHHFTGLLSLKPPVLLPQCVFAAGRAYFDFVAFYDFTPAEAKQAIFDHLPLEEHGWDFKESHLYKLGMTERGLPIWKLMRA